MDYRFIKTQDELSEYLKAVQDKDWIAFDTEFISEGKFSSELCLIQARTADGPVLIDALSVPDLTPFWLTLCRPEMTVIVHSCRSEMEFCFKGIGRLPENLFDIQMAVGFLGLDYPISLKKIAEEILHIEVPKEETRTDWRQRPLTLLQIEYALGDVEYLPEIAEKLRKRLLDKGRYDWFLEEMAAYRVSLQKAFADTQWRKLPGISSLGRRELAIVRDLWNWREKKAASSGGHRKTSHILRDDLIVELARRKTADPERIAALRGISKRNDVDFLKKELSRKIESALAEPEENLPMISSLHTYPSYSVATSFLMAVIQNEAKKKGVALGILASPHDVRDLIAKRAGTLPESMEARLDFGWRREFLGTLPDEIFSGKKMVRLASLNNDAPLAFD